MKREMAEEKGEGGERREGEGRREERGGGEGEERERKSNRREGAAKNIITTFS